MAQYSTGTVSTTQGSTTITGADTLWLTANLVAGDMIRIGAGTVYWEIASVVTETQILLLSPFSRTLSAVSYEILTDFTPNRDYPLLNQGDLHAADIISRALRMIDKDVSLGFIWLGSVIDKDLNAAPTSGLSDGDAYIVAAGVPSGDAWFGQEGKIAIYDITSPGSWSFLTPEDRNYLLVEDESLVYIYVGDHPAGAWLLWNVKGAAGTDRERWTPIPDAYYTAVPASAVRITMSNTTGMATGKPVRWTSAGSGSGYGWGWIKAISTNAYIDIRGYALPINSGDSITELWVGSPEMVIEVPIPVSGHYGDGTTCTVQWDDMHIETLWLLARGRILDMRYHHRTGDTGSQPTINLYNVVEDTDVFDIPLSVGTAWAWARESGADLNTAVNFAEIEYHFDIHVETAGGNGDAEDLQVYVLLVVVGEEDSP